MTDVAPGDWPALPLAGWRETYATLHMWTQVVGKICLAATAPTNHWWNVAFRVGARGLSTPLLGVDGRAFSIAFDFVDHRLSIRCADGRADSIELAPQTVADFYAAVVHALGGLDLHVPIRTMPVEVPEPIPFERDTLHRSYDPAAANAYFRALASMYPVFDGFRGRFIGKCSPVHFFWGSFDLAVTRFSGRRAPERRGADRITREAYSHEVVSHGFWPGGGSVPDAAFYAYAAPEPEGFKAAAVRPAAVRYLPELGEFILPYDAVRSARRPGEALIEFLDSTYEQAARLARWDRATLER